MKHEKLSYKIIGCAMKVHQKLGNGFQEVIYQRCLAIEFDKKEIFYLREDNRPIFYEGIQVGTRRADFIVEDIILIELKAVIELQKVHLAQSLNYLNAYDLQSGLLINFGSPSLNFKRLYRK